MTMRLLIQVLDDPLASAALIDVPLPAAHEFKVLWFALEPARRGHSLADMIGGLVSIGIDLVFQDYTQRNLRAHHRKFGLWWNATAGRAFQGDYDRTREALVGSRRDGHRRRR